MNKFIDTSEKWFQKYIVKEIVGQNIFRESEYSGRNRTTVPVQTEPLAR